MIGQALLMGERCDERLWVGKGCGVLAGFAETFQAENPSGLVKTALNVIANMKGERK